MFVLGAPEFSEAGETSKAATDVVIMFPLCGPLCTKNLFSFTVTQVLTDRLGLFCYFEVAEIRSMWRW